MCDVCLSSLFQQCFVQLARRFSMGAAKRVAITTIVGDGCMDDGEASKKEDWSCQAITWSTCITRGLGQL